MKTKEKPIPPDQRRALTVLAWSGQEGMTEALLLHAHEVPVEVLVKLIHAGLASVSVEKLARPAIEVTRVQITSAGRAAIRAHQGTQADDP